MGIKKCWVGIGYFETCRSSQNLVGQEQAEKVAKAEAEAEAADRKIAFLRFRRMAQLTHLPHFESRSPET